MLRRASPFNRIPSILDNIILILARIGGGGEGVDATPPMSFSEMAAERLSGLR